MGAEVTITHKENNQVSRTATNDMCYYQTPYLKPGLYRVEFAMQGFMNGTREDVAVKVEDRLRIDFRMEVGEVTETLEPTSKGVTGKKNDPMMPVAWTKMYESPSGNEARVFCTTMGAATDLEAEGTRRMIVNAVYWTLKIDEKIAEKSNVAIVGEFKPTNFKFDGFVKGKKPADYAK